MTIAPNSLASRHGGDLSRATACYGTPPEGWLDLSTGINPLPYPAPLIDAQALAALPDRGAYDALIATARGAYGVPPGAKLVATPGSEIALRLLPFVLPDGPVAIVGPTYGSHHDAWAAARGTVRTIGTIGEIPRDTATAVLVNPNNPDGRTISRSDLTELAAELATRGGTLVVDEAFADLDPQISLGPCLDSVSAVVLRSFGKFFGLAGLRLGFVAGSCPAIERLARLFGDWPVSSAALAIGHVALTDVAWQAETRAQLAVEAGRLRNLVQRHGLTLAGGTDLFVLIENTEAARLHTRLAEAGIWTRIFPYRRDWIRIGLPGGEAGFSRLERALARSTSLI